MFEDDFNTSRAKVNKLNVHDWGKVRDYLTNNIQKEREELEASETTSPLLVEMINNGDFKK